MDYSPVINKTTTWKKIQYKTRVQICVNNVLKNTQRSLKRVLETLTLYYFTQSELCLILLYKVVKGSTNQGLITNKYSDLSLLVLQVFSRPLLAQPLDFPWI